MLSTAVLVVRTAEDALVECWHQRSALAACGHIAAAHVGDDGDACALCQQGWVLQLQGVAGAIVLLGLVAHSLAVGANRAHVAGRGAASIQQLLHHVGISAADGIARQRCTVQLDCSLGGY